jgi:hypothetical protein
MQAGEPCTVSVRGRHDSPNVQVLRTTVWINIFDLMDAKRTGRPVKKHASANALRAYTRRTKKIFPKKAAKDNQFLKVLLVEIFV